MQWQFVKARVHELIEFTSAYSKFLPIALTIPELKILKEPASECSIYGSIPKYSSQLEP